MLTFFIIFSLLKHCVCQNDGRECCSTWPWQQNKGVAAGLEISVKNEGIRDNFKSNVKEETCLKTIPDEEREFLSTIFSSIPRKKRTTPDASRELLWRIFSSIPRKKRTHVTRKSITSKKFASSISTDLPPERKISKSRNRCDVCNIIFRYEVRYLEHVRKRHSGKKPYWCAICSRGFKRKFTWKRHLKYHPETKEGEALSYERIRVFKCGGNCDFETARGKAFEEHVLERHPDVPAIPCRYCPRKFFRFRTMRKHEISSHDSEHKFHCERCERFFGKTDALMEHERNCAVKTSNLKKGQYLTTDLNRGSNEVKITELENGENVPALRRYCDLCRVTFHTFTQYRNHRMKQHPREKVFKCDLCDKSYSSNTYFENHLASRHGDDRRNSSHKNKNKDHSKYLVYTCRHCGAEFVGVKAYELHGARAHPGKKLFRCGDCGVEFVWKCSLIRHVKEKHGANKTRCSNCPASYYRTDYLRKHEEYCGKKRKLKEEWKRRAGEEAGIRPIYCRQCDDHFYYKSKIDYYKHVYRDRRYDQCKICRRRFHKYTNPEGLTLHMKERHPCHENIEALLRSLDRFKSAKAELQDNDENAAGISASFDGREEKKPPPRASYFDAIRFDKNLEKKPYSS